LAAAITALQSMTPEADMASGNNGIYVFALPQ
jgi:hypothetical protein